MRKQAIKQSFSLISSKKTGPFQGIVRSQEKKNRQDSSEAYPYCLSSYAQSSLTSYFALHDSLRDTGPNYPVHPKHSENTAYGYAQNADHENNKRDNSHKILLVMRH